MRGSQRTIAAVALLSLVSLVAVALLSRLVDRGMPTSYGSSNRVCGGSKYSGELSVGSQSPSPSAGAAPAAAHGAVAGTRPATIAAPDPWNWSASPAFIRVNYYTSQGAFRIYVLGCVDGGCLRPLEAACGQGTLTVTAYGTDRSNARLHNGPYSGCTSRHATSDFPAGIYFAIPTYAAARHSGEHLYYSLTGDWTYQGWSRSINSSGEIPPGD